MSFLSNLTNHFSIKWALIAIFTYLLLTVLGSAILSSIWMADYDVMQLSAEQIATVLNNDTKLNIYLAIVGSVSAVICFLLVMWRSDNKELGTLLVLVVFLTLYGAVSISLHPEHHLVHQLLKLIMPGLLGALVYRMMAAKPA